MVLLSQYLRFSDPTPLLCSSTTVSFYSSSMNISGPLSLFQCHNIVQSPFLYLTTFNKPNLCSYTGMPNILQQLYKGPFKVIQPSMRPWFWVRPPAKFFFKVEKGRKQEAISVDKFKLVHINWSTIVLACHVKTSPWNDRSLLTVRFWNI